MSYPVGFREKSEGSSPSFPIRGILQSSVQWFQYVLSKSLHDTVTLVLLGLLLGGGCVGGQVSCTVRERRFPTCQYPLRDSGVLDNYTPSDLQDIADEYGIEIETTEENGDEQIVFPADKHEATNPAQNSLATGAH